MSMRIIIIETYSSKLLKVLCSYLIATKLSLETIK